MRSTAGITRRWRVPAGVTASAMLLALAAACGGSSTGRSHSPGSGAGSGSALATTAENPRLAATVLVDRRGMTLYSLSAERSGRFICTRNATVPGGTTPCLSLWRPLLVGPGARPAGTTGSLGIVKRPDGVGDQVTYRGEPLYTFVDDRAPGDVSGDGFKDVGIWRPVTVGAAPTAPSTGSSGRGY